MRALFSLSLIALFAACGPACELPCGPGTEDEDCDGFPAYQGHGETFYDCDDADDEIHPGAEEVCDFVDNDCDNERDEGQPLLEQWPDMDNDGYGDGSQESYFWCRHLGDSAFNPDDCNDRDPAVTTCPE